ncbi:hypothetical protein NL676_030104 [Syzygium grande]|nr:hypothetical protein NL676_030104 [Syzygium grande]
MMKLGWKWFVGGTEGTPELAGDDAHVLHADDSWRAETPLRLRLSRTPLHRLSLLLLQRLRHWRSLEAPQDQMETRKHSLRLTLQLISRGRSKSMRLLYPHQRLICMKMKQNQSGRS